MPHCCTQASPPNRAKITTGPPRMQTMRIYAYLGLVGIEAFVMQHKNVLPLAEGAGAVGTCTCPPLPLPPPPPTHTHAGRWPFIGLSFKDPIPFKLH